jgi:serine phosphatase RsbU (regulator of sigma subunit)
MMPSDALLEQLLPRFFTYFKPRDIVSGDFYWANRDKNNVFLAVADCTGHGVPGAFMSILGISLLDKIIKEKEIYEPSLILNELRREIKKLLHQTGTESDQKDGMDISVCVIDLLTMKMKYSGANNNIYLIRKAGNELILTNKVAANKIKTSNYGNLDFIDFKSDRMPIGIYYNEKDSFTQIEFQIEKRDAIYLLTDGYADQFGGEHDQKFYFRNLKDLLIKVQDKSLLEQKRILDETIVKWQGNFPQTDDILVVGIKF